MIEPKLRFKADDGSQFPDWEKKKLEDVVEFLDGQRKPLEAGQRVSGKYPYYGASGIIDYVEDYIFDEELILLSEDGANILDRNYRVCFLAKGKYWVNNHAHVLRAMDGNVNGFICEQLETFDYRKYNSGGAQPKLNQATCRAIIMNMPSLPEQQKIAEFLSTIDTVIEKQKETVSAWEERKKGVMQKLFSQEVRFKADDGSDFPEWEEKKLGDIADVIMGQSPDGDSVNLNDGLYLIQGKADLLGSNIVPERLTNKPTKICEPLDLVMTVRAPVGYVVRIEFKACIGRGVCAIRAKKIDSNYLLHYMTFKESEWKKIEQGSTFTAVNSDDVKTFKVSVPCLKEQQKIADCLSSFDEVIEKQKATLAAWEELKKGLLQQMFV